MRLGGWARLGVLLSGIYALVVATIAYLSHPKLEEVQSAWIDEAAQVIAPVVWKAEGGGFSPYELRNELLKERSYTQVVALLDRMANAPNDKQEVFSAALAVVNKKHQLIVDSLPRSVALHWIQAAAWWALGTALMFGSGLSIRWVYRGFRDSNH